MRNGSWEFIDLAINVPPLRETEDEELFRIAVHETGHAILAKVLDLGKVEFVKIFDFKTSFPEDGAARGHTKVLYRGRGYKTRKDFADDIAMYLGGMIAEELILGDRSTSAGGTPGSDLAQATKLATEMNSLFGLGSSLAYCPGELEYSTRTEMFPETGVRDEVNAILNKEYQRAKQTLASLKPLILAVAMALRAKRRLEESELNDLFESAMLNGKKAVRR